MTAGGTWSTVNVSTARTTGTGCRGSFEAIQRINGHDLCVAQMVTIPASDAGDTGYQIDATEVTRGQYHGWVATNPPLPDSGDVACGWKASGSYAEISDCPVPSLECQETDCDHYPAGCVDWCDAYYYCAAVGKRLCGRIGGGSSPWRKDTGASQWYRACSSAGANTYAYGDEYEPGYCADSGRLEVGMRARCQSTISGYSGVYDLSGGVWEWEDFCDNTTGASDLCRLRGGGAQCVSVGNYSGCWKYDQELQCGYDSSLTRNLHEYSHSSRYLGYVGFRCCSR